MSVRRANAILLSAGLLVVVVVLYLGGCFAHRISASRTEALLKAKGGTTWRRVTCEPYEGGYWDYACHIDQRGARPFTVEVKVNGNKITDQSAP